MRRASRLLLGVALLAGGLTVGGPGALVPRAVAAGTGGTTVSVQGSVVTITVNMDLCCHAFSHTTLH